MMQPDQGLGAGHEGAAALERPFVVERNLVLRQRVGLRAVEGCIHSVVSVFF
jgi:hypothetical protein